MCTHAHLAGRASEQSGNAAFGVHIDALGGGHLGQAGHGHHFAGQSHNKACAGRYLKASHGHFKVVGAPRSLALSLKLYWVLAMQMGRLPKPSS